MSAPSTIVACPACNGLNRVPDARLAEAPKCGKCGAALFAAHPLALDEAGFHAHVERAELPVLVDFWAPWCGPCRMVGPVIDSIAEEVTHAKVGKVNVDDYPEIAARYGVMSIPTLIVFENGQPAARFQGASGKAGLLSNLDGFL